MPSTAKKGPALFELETRLAGLLDEAMQADEMPEGLDDEIALALADTNAKRDAVAFKMQEIRANAERFRDYAKMFTERARVYENKYAKLREYVSAIMQAEQRTELKGDAFKFRLARNPDRVEVTDESKLPVQCVVSKLVVSPDKKLIMDLIESGQEVPGAELVQGDVRVDIKAL